VARALEELGREVETLRNKVVALEGEKTASDAAPEKPRIVASSE